jgi:dihydrofolate reductase
MTIKMIAAVSLNGVIGNKTTNNLPWGFDEFPEDMKYFRSITAGATVIMGRNTFESLNRPAGLPKRRNIIISSNIFANKYPEIEVYRSFEDAIESCTNDEYVWLIGGSWVYQKGLEIVSEIHLTTIPKIISGNDNVYFPCINLDVFRSVEPIELNKDKNLYVNIFIRK